MAVASMASSLHGVSQAKVVKYNFTWTIEYFSFCCERTGEYLESPPFSVCVNNNKALKWCIKICSKRNNSNNSEYFSLYLQLISSYQDIINAKIDFSLLNSKRNKGNTQSLGTRRFQLNTAHYIEKFVTRQSMLDEVDNLLPEDKLTILCEVAVIVERRNLSQDEVLAIKAPTRCLSEDFSKLFDNKILSDITLVVDGKEIQAHRVILAVRSPVFAAMFQHQTEELKSNHVYVTDISHDVLAEMIQFMYTDRAPNINNMPGDLLAAADKYAMESLKVMCEETLYKMISVETAADTLVLADRHSAKWLKAQTIGFINAHHANEVMTTKGWQSMIPAYPSLVAEVLQALAIQQQEHLPLHNKT